MKETYKDSRESDPTILCKSCGLCCTGHLFTWTKLRSPELDLIRSLGVRVFREPQRRGFDQPCPLWDGVCTIYEDPSYPRFCQTYKCKLLKQLSDEVIPLHDALKVVGETKSLVRELDAALPDSSSTNFRERLESCIVDDNADETVRVMASRVVEIFESRFGVKDLPAK